MTTIAPPPPAPVGPPPPVSPGSRTALRVAIVGIAALVVLGTVVSLGVAAWGLSTVRVVTDRATLPTGLRVLTIETGDVPMAVRVVADRNAGEPRVDLRMVRSSRSSEHRLTVTNDASGSRVAVNGDGSSFMQWGKAGEVTVTLPPESARRLSLTTDQETGVLMADADVDTLVARVTNGAILLRGSARSVDVRTTHGDVDSRDPISVSESFRADTVNGDIDVDFTNAAPETVDLVTRRGDIVVGLPGAGPYLVRAQSGATTAVRVPETRDEKAAVATVTARSDDGDVTVESRRLRG